MARSKITSRNLDKSTPVRPARPARPAARMSCSNTYQINASPGQGSEEEDPGSEEEDPGSEEDDLGYSSTGADSENDSGTAESESAMDWTFNQELHLVLHDVDRCRMCGEFALHYAKAKIRSDPSYHTAWSACKRAIAGEEVTREIDSYRQHLDQLNKFVMPRMRGKLEGIRDKIETDRENLEKLRHELEEARRVRAAASGPHTAESSRRPRPSRSPSPRPHKLSRYASSSSTL